MISPRSDDSEGGSGARGAPARDPRPPDRPRPVRGTLHVCATPEEATSNGPSCTHRSRFANAHGARYLEDNDIRGFLDGGFRWGWNQPGQDKVRLGRTRSSIRPPKFGEDELFRVLQRWTGIALPPQSRVVDARLRLHAVKPLEEPRRVYLYPVRRDWNAGKGGVRGDNVSVPRTGEVWWRAARHEREPWGLPGAGFADDTHPEGDTAARPLALAEGTVGTRVLDFEDDALTRHVEDRLARDEPLLFLLKLSDLEEDEPGSLLMLASAEHGASGAAGRRPSLRLAWRPPERAECRRERVFLEHGRRTRPVTLGPEDGRTWVTFEPDEGSGRPVLQRREPSGAPARGASAWRRMQGPVESDERTVEIRTVAARDPLELGSSFSARLRNTWVVSAPPEEQELEWRFLSPSGVRHRVTAEYAGEFTWRVEFVPCEIGRWRARWRHAFAGPVQTGPERTFDVVPGDLENVRRELRGVLQRAAALPRSGEEKERELIRFLRLERAALRAMTPDAYRSEIGGRVREELRRVREALWGRPVPDEFPMESHELRREVDGRELAEPIPRQDEYFRDGAVDDGSTERLLGSLVHWGREAAKRVLDGAPGGTPSGASSAGGDGGGRGE